MFCIDVPLARKQILVVTDQSDPHLLDQLCQFLLKSNAKITINDSNPIQNPSILQLIRNGHIGFLRGEISIACDYHITIIQVRNCHPKKAQFIQECHNSRSWLSIIGDSQNSDIVFDLVSDTDSVHSQSTLTEPDSDPIISQEITKHELDGINERTSTLYLVGVGPGSVDLMTIRARKLLQSDCVVITDCLVSEDIFKLIPKTTQILLARKTKGRANQAQKEINEWIIEHLQNGRNVVRIKGGDPFVFGRGGEEWNLAVSQGFNVEYVPGISSCISALGAFGIPVTHRGVATSFVVCTGQVQQGNWHGVPEYSSSRTLILLMAITKLESIQKDLIDKFGYPTNEP
ncbi:hypothetical protein HDV02_002646, partial [Globomyces sp. JEL0801]